MVDPDVSIPSHYVVHLLTLPRNSAGLGVYVLMSALFAEVLVKPPFLWGFDTLGYVFAGQVAAAIAVPFFCGNLSDVIVKVLSKRNGGISHVGQKLHATRENALTR
jgi:hypothetical protein